ncbi:hypothetical protein PIB30_070295 [Stylosanthes scabra]|uniref:Uncharacterized protein n=1 Tax=Stylosanthes scabra TaxID=79078 RepID=A0ABU6RNK3_9FABA|nr:hypothetical protein [Stylosanthes scabra]
MTDVIKSTYDTPWLSYEKVPIEVKNGWFEKLKTFDYRMGPRLQQMLRDVRLGMEETTQWMSPALK